MKRKIQEVRKNVYRWTYEWEDIDYCLICLIGWIIACVLTAIYG